MTYNTDVRGFARFCQNKTITVIGEEQFTVTFEPTSLKSLRQEDYDGRGQRTASPMLTAIMSGGVGISGIELSTQLINSLEQANHSFN